MCVYVPACHFLQQAAGLTKETGKSRCVKECKDERFSDDIERSH